MGGLLGGVADARRGTAAARRAAGRARRGAAVTALLTVLAIAALWAARPVELGRADPGAAGAVRSRAGESERLRRGRAELASMTPGPSPEDEGPRTEAATAVAGSPAAARALLADWPAGKPKAAYFMLARNADAQGAAGTVANLEGRFNGKPGARYPWVFINNRDFTDEFVQAVQNVTSSPTFFGKVPVGQWGAPDDLDHGRIAASLRELGHLPHGGQIDYRSMCRYFSGYFFDHPLLDGFDYYWRVEPAVHYTCDLADDPFQTLRDENASYGFNIIAHEIMEFIPGLWPTAAKHFAGALGDIAPHNTLRPLFDRWSPDGRAATALASLYGGSGEARDAAAGAGEPVAQQEKEGEAAAGSSVAATASSAHSGSAASVAASDTASDTTSDATAAGYPPPPPAPAAVRLLREAGATRNISGSATGVRPLPTYLGFHFWSNFEIGALKFLRSPAYRRYFRALEESGGFYYERWGDAPVHSLAVAALLDAQQVWFFEEIGYAHAPWQHCPQNARMRASCQCDPRKDENSGPQSYPFRRYMTERKRIIAEAHEPDVAEARRRHELREKRIASLREPWQPEDDNPLAGKSADDLARRR